MPSRRSTAATSWCSPTPRRPRPIAARAAPTSRISERLVEEAARKLDMDSVRLRRRNLLKKEQFPFKTPTGSTYDSGDPVGLLDCALKEADWDGFAARRRASKKSGRLRGIGCALFLEPSGGVGKEEI